MTDSTVLTEAHAHGYEESCADDRCLVCGLDFEFELPSRIVEAARRRELVIFAGAGISTETRDVFPFSIYDLAVERLGAESIPSDCSFPELMQQFQDTFGRVELVKLISGKLDSVDGFRRARLQATRFHRELATMPYIVDIATTNWDTYFEQECGATPFVTGEDVALWNSASRRVLKIHGSMSNLGSLVATQSDYEARLDKLSTDVMGGLLRQLLATKPVVFVGYSLRDWNFRRLYEALVKDMNGFAPEAYVVSPYQEGETNDLGMRVLKTSGTAFLRELKRKLVGHCNVDDSAYDRVSDLYAKIEDVVESVGVVSHVKYPAIFFTWMYHDGVRDCCDRILHRRFRGEYSDRHHVVGLIKRYSEIQDRCYDQGHYGDVAYIEGYVNVLFAMCFDDPDLEPNGKTPDDMLAEMPLFFFFNPTTDMITREDFEQELEASRRRSPKTRAFARVVTAHLGEGMVLTHGPTLNGIDG